MKIQRIKKSVTEKEYKKLMAYARSDEDIKEFNQKRFFKIFSLLYYSGLRINEITQIKYSHIAEIIKNGETVAISHKTSHKFDEPRALELVSKSEIVVDHVQ